MGLISGDNPRSINGLLLISFVLISLVPVTFLGSQIYKVAWDDAWREIHEKHRLLALNLGSPIRTYIKDHQSMLGLMSMSIKHVNHADPASHSATLNQLQQSLKRAPEFQTLILMDTMGKAQMVISDKKVKGHPELYSKEPSYLETLATNQAQVSGAVYSQLNQQPIILLTYPVLAKDKKVIGVLIGELGITFIEMLRKRIAFGKGGHSAIVDQYGRVVAHPNPKWMAEIRDLSGLGIIQKVMAGENGVTEFYSPFVKEQMVAGYTGVPDIGWGIIVPQPKKEVEEQVYAILSTQLIWAVIGFALAVFFAIVLARWITRPLHRLAGNAGLLIEQDYEGELPVLHNRSPLEIQQLDAVLRDLISGLQHSRKEVSEFNVSLQMKVNEATTQLQITNKQLSQALERTEEFLSFARHDLRKPIAVITDIAESLKSDLDNNEINSVSLTDALSLICKTAKYMNNIVSDFLGNEATVSGKIVLQKTVSSVNDILSLIVKSNERYAERKGIEIRSELDLDIDLIQLDDARISQVCQNLIDNAVKFCQRGDVISVQSYQDQSHVFVRVSDSGPGLTSEDMTQVFNRDVRLSNRPTGGEISTGVGLVICKHIMDLHHGQIGVENNPDKGCSFWFSLARHEQLPAQSNNVVIR